METRRSLREQGYRLRGHLPLLFIACAMVGAVAVILAPDDGVLGSEVRMVGGLLASLCVGVLISQNIPIWERNADFRPSLDQMDSSLPLDLRPFQHEEDGRTLRPVAAATPILLEGADVPLFLAWAKYEIWREHFEHHLSPWDLADDHGRAQLVTTMPLVTFRESFCLDGREIQDEATRSLMERLRIATAGWRAMQVDYVEVMGRAVIQSNQFVTSIH